MQIQNVVVTGDEMFLNRHRFLFESLSSYFETVECLPVGDIYQSKLLNRLNPTIDLVNNYLFHNRVNKFWKSASTFIKRSRTTEQKIKQLNYVPDLVFHVFCMFSPFWDNFDIPYVMYLDYTMTLIKKNWLPWFPFENAEEFDSWFNCESLVYKQASYIFTMSHLVKKSLIEDYSVQAEKIKVVGSSGNFQELYEGEKKFGSKQILFNGSEFERKGGDLVVAAFKQVKQVIPDAKLVVIGKNVSVVEDGIVNPGHISSREEMQNLFLASDLVVAPSRCDPFPTFLLEAMNYGVPCIVAANDGMPEIIDRGVNGIVISQLKSEILAEQIIDSLCNISLLSRMSQQARHKVKTQLNWNNIAKNISQVLLTEI